MLFYRFAPRITHPKTPIMNKFISLSCDADKRLYSPAVRAFCAFVTIGQLAALAEDESAP